MAFLNVGNCPVVRMDVQLGVAEMAGVVAGTDHVMVMVAHWVVVGQVTECGHSMLMCSW